MTATGLAAFLALWSAWEGPNREGSRLQVQAKYQQAEQYYRRAREALQLFERREAPLAAVVNNLSAIEQRMGRFAEAEKGYREAEGLLQAAGPAYESDRARTLANLGALAMNQGRLDDSARWLDQARDIQQRLRDAALGHTLLTLANLELLRGNADAAGQSLAQSRKAMESFGMVPGDDAGWSLTQCWWMTVRGNHEEASKACDAALPKVLAEYGPGHPHYAQLELRRAQIAAETGKLDDAAGCYRAAAAIYARVYGENSISYARATLGLASIRRNQRQYPSALSLAQNAVRIFAATPGSSPIDQMAALQLLGDIERAQGHSVEAENAIRRALALAQQTMGEDSTAAADVMNTLAAALFERPGARDEAGRLLERCIAIRESKFGPLHAALSEPVSNLGFVRLTEGRFGEAARLFERSLAIRQQVLGTEHSSHAPVLAGYAESLDHLNRKADAKWARSLARKLAAGPDNPARHVLTFTDWKSQAN